MPWTGWRQCVDAARTGDGGQEQQEAQPAAASRREGVAPLDRNRASGQAGARGSGDGHHDRRPRGRSLSALGACPGRTCPCARPRLSRSQAGRGWHADDSGAQLAGAGHAPPDNPRARGSARARGRTRIAHRIGHASASPRDLRAEPTETGGADPDRAQRTQPARRRQGDHVALAYYPCRGRCRRRLASCRLVSKALGDR